MFRSPKCVSYLEDGNETAAELFNECVNCALRYEIRKYFKSPSGYDEIVPVEDPTADARIAPEELDKLDIPLVMSLFDDVDLEHICPQLRLDGTDAGEPEDFLAAKFLQLVKLVKAEKMFTPDLIGEMIIVFLAYNGSPFSDSGFRRVDELKKLFLAELEELNNEADLELSLSDYRGECYSNLRSLIDADEDIEVGYILWDIDYQFLYEDNDGSGLLALMLGRPDYPEEYWVKMYHSVGYSTPLLLDQKIRDFKEIDMDAFREEQMRRMDEFFSFIRSCENPFAADDKPQQE